MDASLTRFGRLKAQIDWLVSYLYLHYIITSQLVLPHTNAISVFFNSIAREGKRPYRLRPEVKKYFSPEMSKARCIANWGADSYRPSYPATRDDSFFMQGPWKKMAIIPMMMLTLATNTASGKRSCACEYIIRNTSRQKKQTIDRKGTREPQQNLLQSLSVNFPMLVKKNMNPGQAMK